MKRIAYSTGFLAIIIAGFITTTAVLAQTSSIPFIVSNTLGVLQTSLQVPVAMSSVTLIDGYYMDADGLDTDVKTSDVSVGYMPGTDKVRVLACFNDLAVDETSQCNDAIPNDVTIPVTGTGVYEFAADNQFSTLWLNISQPAVASWTIQWQYYDGSSYIAFSSISDGTANFTSPGLHRVTWEFPVANTWPLATLHGVEGYWVRAEVTSLTSLTQAPIAEQVWYETGRWWTLSETLGPSAQQEFNIEFGITPDPKDFHYYFPHTDGIVVTDDATLELTGSLSVKVWKGYFDVTAPITGTKKIAFKEDSVELIIPSDGIIQVTVYP